MKNYIYYLFFLSSLVFSQQNTSPSLISSAGASLEGWGMTSLKMDFSIGEIMIDTGFSSDFLITQGFHQEATYISTLIEEINIDLAVFPNPTNSIINIDLKSINDFPVKIELFDITGKEWGGADFVYKNTHSMSLQPLAEGIYFLLVENKNFKNIYQIHKIK